MNNEIYKIYQLMEFFIVRYSYNSLAVKNLMGPNEIYCINKDEPNFKIIRISNEPQAKTQENEARINAIIEVAQRNFGIGDATLLDIHINREEADEDSSYETVCIDTDYISGIDLGSIYPGIESAIHEVENQENEIKKLVVTINEAIRNVRKQAKKRPLLIKLKEQFCPVTLSVIFVSIISFVLYSILKLKTNSSAALIFLGADYKAFTIGLHQYYRLVTYAFNHSSLLHLLCNMMSLYFVGRSLERSIGSFKYAMVLFCGILFASLTHDTISMNSLTCGMSGGIYAIFAYMIMYYIEKGYLNLNAIMPTLFLNMMLNFMPGVAWQSHLGGAVCGLMFYYIFQNPKVNVSLVVLVIVMLLSMAVKTVRDNNIKPFYGATDISVVALYDELGFKKAADRLENKLVDLYIREKGGK